MPIAKSGEIDSSESISGDVLVNGARIAARRRRQQIGYVYQEDILLETMTVREAVWMAARLKLPQLADVEVRVRVDDILARMRLEHIQQSRIGSALQRGIFLFLVVVSNVALTRMQASPVGSANAWPSP